MELLKQALFTPIQLSWNGWAILGYVTYDLPKRIIDLVLCVLISPFAILVITIFAPFVTADGGSLFFVQERVGKGGRRFQMYKIRTMLNGEVTGIGRFLRMFRLDELPQIWNIAWGQEIPWYLKLFMGDMSFVGPRPRPYFEDLALAAIVPGYLDRQGVIPGITGWAQIAVGRHDDDANKIRKTVFWEGLHLKYRNILVEYLILPPATAYIVIVGRGK